MTSSSEAAGDAQVIGIGLIGGSVAAALREQGWRVSGVDSDAGRAEEARRRKIIDFVGLAEAPDVTFVATPVSSVVEEVRAALSRGGVVTDVASVKGPIVAAIADERFVAGHPMAGSEVSGLEGVDPALFQGATWVLTPSANSNSHAYLKVRAVVSSIGADVVTLDPNDHDEMVATISHVPHFAASALMGLAISRSRDHAALLRLAAGGFRDMTRIAAGHPQLWADIALENRAAIADGLARLSDELGELRELITDGKREQLEEVLQVAADARKHLPLRAGRPARLSVVRVPIPDRPGALGQVLGIFGSSAINVEDLDIAHNEKGDRGVLQLTIATDDVETARMRIEEAGFMGWAERL